MGIKLKLKIMDTTVIDKLDYSNQRTSKLIVNTGIPEDQRKVIADGLAKVLADSYLLMIKTHLYHWNVKGGLFYTIHEMTEQQYTDLFEAIDVIAERIRALGYDSPGTISEFSQMSLIKDGKISPSESEIIADLLTSHEGIVRTIRDVMKDASKAGDEVTLDMLTGRSNVHEKTAWMWRSFLEK